MPYLYLVVSVILSATASVFCKFFTKKNSKYKNYETFYNFLLISCVFLGWLIFFIFDFSFEPSVLWFSLMFGIFFFMGFYGMVMAIKFGSVLLTALFINLSLIIVTIWGFIFWGEVITFPVIIGLILVVLSIFLCVYTKSDKKESVSLKWFLFVLIAFVGNAGCTIVQRTQQVQYDGQHGTMMMAFATCISMILYLIIFLKSDKTGALLIIKKSGWLAVCGAISNFLMNFLVMLLALSFLSASLIYPVISVGGLGVVTLFSFFVFKERLHWWQWVGLVSGAVAIAILSI